MVPSLEQGRTWLGLGEEQNLDDARITLLLQATTPIFETYAQTALLARAFTQQFEGGDDLWILDIRPVISVVAIQDPAGNSIPATSYLLHSKEGMLEFYGVVPIPRTATGARSLWTVAYVAGLFGQESEVPKDLVAGMLTMMARLYFNPEPMVQSRREGDSATAYIPNPTAKNVVPPEVELLWSQYRRRSI